MVARNKNILYGLKGTTQFSKENQKKRKYVHGDGPVRREKCLNCTKPASECKGKCF